MWSDLKTEVVLLYNYSDTHSSTPRAQKSLRLWTTLPPIGSRFSFRFNFFFFFLPLYLIRKLRWVGVSIWKAHRNVQNSGFPMSIYSVNSENIFARQNSDTHTSTPRARKTFATANNFTSPLADRISLFLREARSRSAAACSPLDSAYDW